MEMDFWVPTQRVLQGEIPLVKRPKLTDALLRKPPFRFLHDVIVELCRQTGYARGLYTQEDLNSSNIKDKESKVMYLQKIIDCVGITLQASVPARPLKIVAGLEPEQTNVFLQMLAAATMVDKETSQRAVARVLAGEKQPLPGQGGTQWIQLLKKMMSPGGLHSSPTLHQPQETSQQHSPTKKHNSPTKNASNQKFVNEIISSLEAISSCEVPISQIEQRDESPQPLKKASKSGSKQANGMSSSKSPTKSSQPHESQTTKSHGNISSSHNSQSQHQLSTCSGSHKTGSKEMSAPKRHQSKHSSMSRSAADQPAKVGSSTSKTSAINEPSLRDVVYHTIPCDAEEARSSNVALTNYDLAWEHAPSRDINDDSETEAKPAFQYHREVDVFARSPIDQDLAERSLCLTGTSEREGKCIDNPMLRESAPLMFESIVPKVEPRPLSARKAPPTTKCSFERGGPKFMQGTSRGTSLERPTSAMQSGRKPNILCDNELNDEEEQDSMPLPLTPQVVKQTILSSVEGARKLVCNILDSKNSFEDEESARKCNEQTGIILGQTRGSLVRKERKQTKEEEIQQLKEAVQMLCQRVNPLGKSMDYLQEDVETMSKEYKFWVKERDLHSSKLEEEKRVTQSMLQIQLGRVIELDEEMHQQNQQINIFKAQILRNDENVAKLLRMLTTRTTSLRD